MSDFERLLEVQALDTRADQLRYRLEHDPLVAERAAAQGAVAEVDASIGRTQRSLDAVRSEQSRHESAVAELESRIAREDARLYDGSITGHKDLEALQHEIATLRAMQRDAEDRVIEQMELAEPIDTELTRLGECLLDADGVLERASFAVTAMVAEIDAELDAIASERSAVASGLPDALLAAYDRIRAGAGGTGAARLGAGGRCEGCHLTLSRVDYDQIKRAPADEIVTCPECGRILVR